MLTPKVPGNELIYTPYVWRDIIAKVAVQVGFPVLFDWGHYEEVQKQLQMKTGGMTDNERKKYPLVWLVCDFAEDKGDNMDLYSENKHQLIIAMNTDVNYTMQQRAEISFLPVLYPIYSSILTQIHKDFRFESSARDLIKHTKIDRPYWAGGQKMGQNLFSDFIDALEIRDLQVQIKQPVC